MTWHRSMLRVRLLLLCWLLMLLLLHLLLLPGVSGGSACCCDVPLKRVMVGCCTSESLHGRSWLNTLLRISSGHLVVPVGVEDWK